VIGSFDRFSLAGSLKQPCILGAIAKPFLSEANFPVDIALTRGFACRRTQK